MSELRKGEKRKFPMLVMVSAAVFISLLLSFFLGQSGVIRLRELNEEYERVLMENHRLAMENKKSASEIKKLRHDPAAVEKIAREELQYVSPADIVLVVPESNQ